MLGTQVAIAAEPSPVHAYMHAWKIVSLGGAPKRLPNPEMGSFFRDVHPADCWKLRNYVHQVG